MENYELILLPSHMPGKICLYKLISISSHRHREMELLFVLSGTVKAFINNQTCLLHKTDILVVNSMEMHELYSENAEMVSLEIALADDPYLNPYKDCIFDCCSSEDTSNEKYDHLRYLFARLIKESAAKDNPLVSLSLIVSLLNELVTNFIVTQNESKKIRKDALNQLNQITDYIHAHYKEALHLEDLAEKFHFSQPSLSRFFKHYMGITFTDYYNNIRLEKALAELLSGNESIVSIALNHGFSDARSMTALFKKKYNMLPGEYRTKHAHFIPQSKILNEVNYLAVTTSSSLSALAQYLKKEEKSLLPSEYIEASSHLDIGPVNMSASGNLLKHTWRKICCVGSARDLLYGDIQEMLRRLQREMPFQYVVFHGILSDDVMMYDERPDGHPVLSFTLFDKIIDFLMGIGLKPIMQLSFMPAALASDPQKTNFFMKYNTSLPKNPERWQYLITSLIYHCIERYSLKEVLTWPFYVWNEPDTTIEMFGFEDKDAFFRFYELTYKTVKNINPELLFGTPSLLFLLDDPLDWYHPFFNYCREHDCFPEFLNIHFYDDDITLSKDSPGGPILNKLAPNEDSFSNYLDKLCACMENYGIDHLPVYMTEWNLTVNQRNLINDTCFKACYLTKNLLENYDRLESFGYWSVSDLVGEIQPSMHLFHGGLGMFTINGLAKSHYYAFLLISKLGDQRLASGKGFFITRDSQSGHWQMILYNYTHYNKLLSAGEMFDMTLTKRYTAFSHLKACKVTAALTQLHCGRYRIRETRIHQQFGSSYDTWVRMGASDVMSDDDLSYLHAHSQPDRHVYEIPVENGTLSYTQLLEPLEVRLVEICEIQYPDGGF